MHRRCRLMEDNRWLMIYNCGPMYNDRTLMIHERGTLNHNWSPMHHDVRPMVNLGWRMVDYWRTSHNNRVLLRACFRFLFLCVRKLNTFRVCRLRIAFSVFVAFLFVFSVLVLFLLMLFPVFRFIVSCFLRVFFCVLSLFRVRVFFFRFLYF